MTLDISNFYLGTPVDRPEYMRLTIKLIPEEITQHHKLKDKGEDGWVYIKILAGMYGVLMANKLAKNLLKNA